MMGPSGVLSVEAVAMNCPYPACQEKQPKNEGLTCVCEWKRPLVRCMCGMVSRGDALYCRACARSVGTLGPDSPEAMRPGVGTELAVPGSFRHGPHVVTGWIVAQTFEGVVLQMSTRMGAVPWEAGRFSLSGVGFNDMEVLAVPGQRDGRLRAWCCLGISREGIEVIKLVTGESRVIYRPGAGEELAASAGEADALRMRGLSAGPMGAVFVVSHGETQALGVIALDEDRPAERWLQLKGREVAGPVIAGGQVAVCTERQLGVANGQGGAKVMDLPRWFEPMFVPGRTGFRVARGSRPLVVVDSQRILIAGTKSGKGGFLEMSMGGGRAPQFQEVGAGSCLVSPASGAAVLSTPNQIEVFGLERRMRFQATPESGMPANSCGPMTTWFDESPYPEIHRLNVRWGGHQRRIEFVQDACTPESCFGAAVEGAELLVSYLAAQESGEQTALRVMRWGLTETV